ncbi:MAG: monovalent cation/H(+) antiporter subunit G [Rubrobacter sp.]
MAAVFPFLADALVVLGVVVMTVGVYGIVRLPDTYARLHAASKVVSLGVVSLLLASTVTVDPAVVFRVALIGAFLVVTTPVSAHVVARAAYLRGERMESRGAVDESGKLDTGS